MYNFFNQVENSYPRWATTFMPQLLTKNTLCIIVSFPAMRNFDNTVSPFPTGRLRNFSETGAISFEVYCVDVEIASYISVDYTVELHDGLFISV